MAYEVFERTAVRVETPALSFTPDGRIVLNAAAVRLFAEAAISSVLLLWDKDSHKLALKAAPKNDKNAYAVSSVRNQHSASLRAKSFFTYIGWNASKRILLQATWYTHEKLIEVTLPSEHIAPSRSAGKRKV